MPDDTAPAADAQSTAQPESKAVDPFDPESFKEPAIMTAESPDSGVKDASKVKILVFDMGHVFVDFDWDKVCQGFCDKAGITREEFRPVLAHVGSLGYELGHITTDEFLKELNAKLGTAITLAEFTNLWNATFHENQSMADLLQELGKTRPLYLLSNTNENHFEYLEGTYKVTRHFSEHILSYQVGLSKPDSKIYEEVLKRSGHDAAECLFVDDLQPNVDAAKALGMHTIRFAGYDDLKARLTELGIIA